MIKVNKVHLLVLCAMCSNLNAMTSSCVNTNTVIPVTSTCRLQEHESISAKRNVDIRRPKVEDYQKKDESSIFIKLGPALFIKVGPALKSGAPDGVDLDKYRFSSKKNFDETINGTRYSRSVKANKGFSVPALVAYNIKI